MQIRQITIERKNIELLKKGIKPQNPMELIPKLNSYYLKSKVKVIEMDQN
jgi:hypothetical protein